MKALTSIIILIVIAQLLRAEELQTFFPVAERGSATEISRFEEQWYSKHLRLMKEPSLFSSRNDERKEVYRFTLLPTWGDPRCVALEKDQATGIAYIRFSRLDGDGGYDPGKLVEQEQRELDQKEFDEFASLFKALDFEKQPTEDPVMGLDGSQWILERLKGENYHIVVRWTADAYEPKKRGTEAFVELCNWMLNTAPRTKKAEQGGAGQRR
tara:strand:+ start:1811 stop:2446 length:636 start_codon:yes stop_codon:yes gene_type:complete